MTNSYGNGGYDILFIMSQDLPSPVYNQCDGKKPVSRILDCSPNPFFSSISLHLFISEKDFVKLSIIDPVGKAIKTYPDVAPGDLTFRALNDPETMPN